MGRLLHPPCSTRSQDYSCGLACWKVHQEIKCETKNTPSPAPDQVKSASATSKGLQSSLTPEERFICTSRQLRRLRASEDVRDSVNHSALQQVIQEILRHDDPLSTIKDRMKNDPE